MRLILKVQEWMNNLIHKEDGVTAIEYGLIAGLIAVVIIAAVALVGTELTDVFTAISTRLSTVAP
jgi:pilus assembly protein Flp/PilA